MQYNLQATMNRVAVARNTFQQYDKYPRVAFLCSAGVLRSATAAAIFAAPPYNWNTRTAGVEISYALNPVTEQLLIWADRIVFMEHEHHLIAEQIFGSQVMRAHEAKMEIWNIPDRFPYRDEGLIRLLIVAEQRPELIVTVDNEGEEASTVADEALASTPISA